MDRNNFKVFVETSAVHYLWNGGHKAVLKLLYLVNLFNFFVIKAM